MLRADSLVAQTSLEIKELHVVSIEGSVGTVSANGQKTALNPSNTPGTIVPHATKQLTGSSLGTGPMSRAVVVVPSVGTIVLGPETQIRLPMAGKTTGSLELLKGKLFLNLSAEALGKQKMEFRLKTPAALLAVKGTRFFAQSSGGIDTAGVSQGSVEVYEAVTQQSVVVTSGNAVAVKAGQIGTLRPLTEAEKALDRSIDELIMKEAGNSLGMRFVPLPGNNGKVLFSIWETRVQDFARFKEANPTLQAGGELADFKGHKQGPDHPVLAVSWNDGNAFCAWLSTLEGRRYRLPTDHEWSLAVGITEGDDRSNATPESLSEKRAGIFPWGNVWPPPNNAGNYRDIAAVAKFNFGQGINGYQDGHLFTSPVGSYPPNPFGIYDLGGNVWEWCDDWYSAQRDKRVVRGGSCFSYGQGELLSSHRHGSDPASRILDFGFRVVIEMD